jgi:adenylyltransferase/sulfurtransferase
MKINYYNYNNRYSRQILFSPIGLKGQKKLRKAKVVVIGCGGLGSVIVNNLVRSGIGFIRLVDKDKLEISNLQRQMLFDEQDVKKNLFKVNAAKEKLGLINSEVKIETIIDKLNNNNIEKIINDVDLILDGTDNFKTRFLINKICVKSNKPWIYGSVAAGYGMVYSILPGKAPCFSCIFKRTPPKKLITTSSNAGILNSAVNIIASIQTTEALKFLTGNFDSMIKGLLSIDIWNFSIEVIDIKKNEKHKCKICGL